MSQGHRNPTYEREWLEQIARAAGLSGIAVQRFNDQVLERLQIGANEYGEHGYLKRSPNELCRGIQEEAADIAGWSVLASQALDATDISDDDAMAVRLGLIEAAAYSLRAHRAIAAVRERVPVGG